VLVTQSIKERIIRAISRYNRYRVPEVRAELISYDNDSFQVRFTGTFCYTCGFYDYFDDLRYVLKEFNLSTEILEVKEVDGGAIVKFKLIKEN